MNVSSSSRSPSTWAILVAVAAIVLQGSLAIAQWNVVNLHPAGATSSRAYGVDGTTQAGYAYVNGWRRASLWFGTADSWVNLDPAGSTQSQARAVSGAVQVGFAYVPVYWHASFWSGAAGSWVNLNPYGTTYSAAYAADGAHQYGVWVSYDQQRRACLWSGSAASWVNLDPYGAMWSEIMGAGSGQQVGRARVNNVTRASLWMGTAESWVDLHPVGASNSFALGVHDGQQVGYANFVGHHAGLWTGTSASWSDLHPEGALQSEALAVHAGEQVGWSSFTELGTRASLWNGTPDSWTDLHAFLPAEFNHSEAFGISHDAQFTYVAGWGWNIATDREEALLWMRPAVIAVEESGGDVTRPLVGPASPNPFNPSTAISYEVPTAGPVCLQVLDASGKLVRTLVSEPLPAGRHEVRWDGRSDDGRELPSAVYLSRLESGGKVAMGRMTLVR